MTKRTRKALIIGAGIAGPVTGVFLKKAGIDPEPIGSPGGMRLRSSDGGSLDMLGWRGRLSA